MAELNRVAEIEVIYQQVAHHWKYISEFEVKQLLQRARALLRESDLRQTITVHACMGSLYLRQHTYTHAAESFAAAHTLTLQQPLGAAATTLLICKAHAMTALNRHDEALEILKQVAELEGEAAWNDSILLASLVEQMVQRNQWEDAAFYLEQARKCTDSTDANQLYWLAHAMALVERYELAVTTLSRVLALTYGTSAASPYEHVVQHEASLNLSKPLQDAVDFMQGMRELEEKLEVSKTEVSPELLEVERETFAALTPSRHRATLAGMK